MSKVSLPTLTDLPREQARVVEEICTRYENEWKRWPQTWPRIENFLQQNDGLLRAVLLMELVRLERIHRTSLGHVVDIEEYRQRFPRQTWLTSVLKEPEASDFPGEKPASLTPTVTYERPEHGTLTPAGKAAGNSPLAMADYEILEELGRGGMGIVYKARHKALNRIVALKMILKGERADSDELARFRTEAEAIARLQHPGIVQIFEIGEHDGRPFFSLEFCSGGGLNKKVRDSVMLAKEAASLVESLARAMHAAHQVQVIHRDLKPANVLLAADGTPKITDFGLAKKLDDVGQTQTGAIMGTPSYMAPEQARGDNAKIGPGTDVYALGAILYECLTGRPPFNAATVMDTLMQVLHEEPAPPRQLNPQIPADLETICLKCLSKEPGKRYDTALSLAEDLGRFGRHEPIVARPVGRGGRLVRWCVRNPSLASSLAAALLILLAGVTVSTHFGVKATWKADEARQAQMNAEAEQQRAENAATEADQARRAEQRRADAEQRAREALAREKAALAQQKKATEDALQASEEQRKRSDFVAYAYRIDAARQAARRGQGFEAQAILRTCDPKLCRWEHDFVLRQTLPGSPHPRSAHEEALIIRGHPNPVFSVAASPDGTRIISGSSDNTVKMWNIRTGEETLSFKGHTDAVFSVAFSPDGKKLVSGSKDRTVKVWDVQTGKELLTFNGHTSDVHSVAFSPDGNNIVSGSDDKTIKIWDSQTGEDVRTLVGHRSAVFSVAISSDGKRIVSCSMDRTVKVWDAATGEAIHSLIGHTNYVRNVCFSPDGKWIASTGADNTVKVWDAQSGKETLSLLGHTAGVSSVCFSPDGRRIVSGGADNAVRVWDSQTGEEAITLTTYVVSSVCFSPDGKRIIGGCADRSVRIWDATTGEEALTLMGHKECVRSVYFSLDGKRIVSGSCNPNGPGSGEVKLWDARTGEELLTVMRSMDNVWSVSFSPDGNRIVSGGGVASPVGHGDIRVWDARTGKELLSFKGHNHMVYSVCFSPDGKRIVSAGQYGSVKVWDSRTGDELLSLKGFTGSVNSVCFSPDGKRIAGCSSGLDRETRKNWGEVRVWDAITGEELLRLKGHKASLLSVCFSPDGKRIVSSGGPNATVKAGEVKVWDSQTGEELLNLTGHTQNVNSVCFSPDCKRIVTASGDPRGYAPGEVKVWDSKTGEELHSLQGHSHCVYGVSYSPDGKHIVSGGADRTIKVWDAPPARETPAIMPVSR